MAIRNNGTLRPIGSSATFSSQNQGTLIFDGVDDIITTDAQLTSSEVAAFTIGGWVKTTESRGRKVIGFENTQVDNGGQYDRQIYIGTDGKAYFGVYDGSIRTAVSPQIVNDNYWYYIVGTYSDQTLKLYVDGLLVATTTATSAEAYAGWWKIGGGSNAWTNGSGGNFAGRLGPTHAYGRALTDAEILSNYNAHKARYKTTNNPIVTAALSSGQTAINVTISATADSGLIPATYALEKATNPAGPWSRVSSALTSSSYTDTFIAASTTYYYRAKFIQSDNKNSEFSSVSVGVVTPGIGPSISELPAFNTATPTKIVSKTGPWNNTTTFQTIQAAINASVPSDIIGIGPGNYFETVRITGKNTTAQTPIYIQALDPNNKPVIDNQYQLPIGWNGDPTSAITVTISNSHVVWDSIDIFNSNAKSALYTGPSSFSNSEFIQEFEQSVFYTNVKILRTKIKGCQGKGWTTVNVDPVYMGGCEILETERKYWDQLSEPSGWASAIVAMGRNISIIETKVGQCLGEGISLGYHADLNKFGREIQATNTVIRGCYFFDTFSGAVYFNNVDGCLFERNIVSQTQDRRFWKGRSGSVLGTYPAVGMGIASESGRSNPPATIPSNNIFGSRNLTIRNNVFNGALVCFGFPLEPDNVQDNIKVQNNTIFAPQRGSQPADRFGCLFNEQFNVTNFTFENNLVYSTEQKVVYEFSFAWEQAGIRGGNGPVWAPTLGNSIYRNNLWSHTPPVSGQFGAQLLGVNSIVSNVGVITNPTYVPNDPWPNVNTFDTNSFKLLPNSPAIGAGVINDVTTDFFGRPRPLGVAPDIGAHQFA
jgi:hypothetical protein